MTQRPPVDVPAEVEITPQVVRALLTQRPDLADQPIVPLAEGWDNVLFRVGEAHVARLPRRAAAVPLVENELRWLPVLAPHLPTAIPEVVHVGRPDHGYPWPWAVVRWCEGTPAGYAGSLDRADVLASFLAALQARPTPPDPPHNPFRSVPLATRTEAMAERAARVDVDVMPLWRDLLSARPAARATWCHGDLHPFNVLVDRGRLCGVIDWGDLHVGDPALDLAAAWMLLRDAELLRDALQVDDDAWVRARCWALYYAVTLLDAGQRGAGAPFVTVGRRTLERVM